MTKAEGPVPPEHRQPYCSGSVTHGTTKGEARKTIPVVFGQLVEAAAAGEVIHIADFGKFTVKDRAERQGRNPKSGEAITIAASKKVSFSASKKMKDRL